MELLVGDNFLGVRSRVSGSIPVFVNAWCELVSNVDESAKVIVFMPALVSVAVVPYPCMMRSSASTKLMPKNPKK